MHLMSFHGEICLISLHGEICCVSFHGEICCHVCHVIPWGDLSYSLCHFMGRSMSDMSCVLCVSWGDLSYVSCHSVERSAVMCLVSFHGEICHKSHVILWGDQCQICVTCHSMGSSVMCIVILWEILCHVSHALPCRDLSCASCHFMGRSASDMSCVLHYPIRSTLTCCKSDQQGTCLHMPCSFGCGRVEFSQDYDLVCLTAQQVVMAGAFVLMLICLH